MKDKEAESLEAANRIIHRLNGRIYGLERSNKELVGAIIIVIEMQKRNYGDGVDTHIELSNIAKELTNLIEKTTGKKIKELLNEQHTLSKED